MQKLGFGKNRAVDELLYNSTNLQSTLRKAGGVWSGIGRDTT